MKTNYWIVAFAALVLAACGPTTSQQEKECPRTVVNERNDEPMELNEFDIIKLLPPDTACCSPLMKAALHRQSHREMDATLLSLQQLSDIMWMANGVNRPDGKRTVPSAMARYPLDTYAVLPNGIYLYDPAAHELLPVVEGDYRELSGLQDFVTGAPLNVVFVADYNRYEGDRPVPADRRLYLAALDAGHCAQNIYLYCAVHGLKTVVRAGAREAELLELLGINDELHQFVVAQTVGR